MNRIQNSLARDPYMWLLRKLQEAVEMNPEATIADGFEYALDCLDRRFREGSRGLGANLDGTSTR